MDYFFMSEEERADKKRLIVMVDESTGNKYMRAVGMKGFGTGAEMHWIIHDMHQELKAWGYPGGETPHCIQKRWGKCNQGPTRQIGPIPWRSGHP